MILALFQSSVSSILNSCAKKTKLWPQGNRKDRCVLAISVDCIASFDEKR